MSGHFQLLASWYHLLVTLNHLFANLPGKIKCSFISNFLLFEMLNFRLGSVSTQLPSLAHVLAIQEVFRHVGMQSSSHWAFLITLPNLAWKNVWGQSLLVIRVIEGLNLMSEHRLDWVYFFKFLTPLCLLVSMGATSLLCGWPLLLNFLIPG